MARELCMARLEMQKQLACQLALEQPPPQLPSLVLLPVALSASTSISLSALHLMMASTMAMPDTAG